MQTDTQVFVFANEEVLVVAFRGTELEMKKDVLTDIDLMAVDIECGGARVHRGFWKAWSSVKTALDEVLGIFGKERELWVTGHSLGGALATLCAFELAVHKRVRAFTFGSPRVGNSEFAAEFCSRIPASDVTRVKVQGDLVTFLPFSGGKFDYQHVCDALVVKDGNMLLDQVCDSRDKDIEALFADGGIAKHLEPAYFDELTRLAAAVKT